LSSSKGFVGRPHGWRGSCGSAFSASSLPPTCEAPPPGARVTPHLTAPRELMAVLVGDGLDALDIDL
jgi:hypothetical protein